MTALLKLVRLDELGTDLDELSLLSYTDGFDLAANGWEEALANGDEDFVTEVLTLRGKAANHNTLATKLQGLIDKLIKANWYKETDAEKYSVWLRAQLADENSARQALIVGASVGKLPLHTWPALNASALPTIGLALDRKPLWEDTVNVAIISSDIDSVGGITDGSDYGTVYGDVPARLARTIFTSPSPQSLTQIWMGIRSDRYGDPDNFVPTWGLWLANGGGSLGEDTSGALTTQNSDAKDGFKVVCDFAGYHTLIKRVKIKVANITSEYADQRGNFTALLRAKITDDSHDVRVRLGTGVYSGHNWQYRGRVPITSENWKLYPLGSVQIPAPGRFANAAAFIQEFAMRIDAERDDLAGDVELHMDCLILIPNDEGFIHCDHTGSAVEDTNVYNLADGKIFSVGVRGSTQLDTGVAQVIGGAPPGSGARIVVAGQRDIGSDLADTLDLGIIYRKRWKSLRGTE